MGTTSHRKDQTLLGARQRERLETISGPRTVIAIDWSGRVDAAGQRKHIVAAVWCEGKVRLEAGRTRDEVATWLVQLARQDASLVVGFDFCFGFPAWFVQEHDASSAPVFWRTVVAEHGERWLARDAKDPRFWGKPRKRPAEFSGGMMHRMLRATDIDCKLAVTIPEEERAARVKGIAPKSVFQIGGAGSVGTASLRGMATLVRLQDAGFHIWPFDRAGTPLVVEMYTRLNTGAVRKSNADARAAYLLQKRKDHKAYAQLTRSVLEKAKASEDAFDALVSCMVMTEHRATFLSLPKPRDPSYRLEGWTWAPPLEKEVRCFSS